MAPPQGAVSCGTTSKMQASRADGGWPEQGAARNADREDGRTPDTPPLSRRISPGIAALYQTGRAEAACELGCLRKDEIRDFLVV